MEFRVALARRWSGRVGRPGGVRSWATNQSIGEDRDQQRDTCHGPPEPGLVVWEGAYPVGKTGEVCGEFPKAPRLRASRSPPATTSSKPSRRTARSGCPLASSSAVLGGGPCTRRLRFRVSPSESSRAWTPDSTSCRRPDSDRRPPAGSIGEQFRRRTEASAPVMPETREAAATRDRSTLLREAVTSTPARALAKRKGRRLATAYREEQE